eukprot:TRINITY_DN6169_c0_g1_i2.p1 TRINITY_DN6169_c0_g1~~TRINITY_DN6169_c0_g1_i2.p1  ORF type:complete len:642 (-),score=215.94 TRINITY_DN6169_c0_g1_i2:264-2189(-)
MIIYILIAILTIIAILIQKGILNIEFKLPSSSSTNDGNNNNIISDTKIESTKNDNSINKSTSSNDKQTLIEEKIENNNIYNSPKFSNPQETEIIKKKVNTTPLNPDAIKILYATQKGTSLGFAKRIMRECKERYNLEVQVMNIENYDGEENLHKEKRGVVFILSTYTDGKPTPSAEDFCEWLDDAANDFRVDKGCLSNLKFAIFGLGQSEYGDNYNVVAKSVDKNLKKMSAKQMLQMGVGDGQYAEESFDKWLKKFYPSLLVHTGNKQLLKEYKKKVNQKRKPITIGEEEEESDDLEQDTNQEPLIDLEDIGDSMSSQKKKEEVEEEELDDDEEFDDNKNLGKEMLTPSLRKSLTKQGYKLIGSHSGVKLCRWTKAMLRGRGGCYKHTFYGIESFRCMEMTPSLACANKCVFCWRHHSNPIGTDFKWKMDEPEFLVEEAIKKHYEMIKELKGVPGVKSDRYETAFQIKHCALSLVGEPIIYPKINEFVDMLHQKKISTFLVTNAQFPEKISLMKPVTQLYISVDAATKESLKTIDRPLFKDFWERFIGCIDEIAKKGQRTVFRLTLVKSWNMEEMNNYAELIARGSPDLIEIKGVTYCGTSTASTLTMKNVPFHEEVMEFSKKVIFIFSKEKFEFFKKLIS